jgi:predicted Zn-dependent protease
LKDSLGNDIYYYQENIFDDELYGQAVKAADKAVAAWPDRLDFRFMKANAYIAYEKESPDMALAYLQELVRENSRRSRPWTFEGSAADGSLFEDAMQEYCFSFYSIGSQASYEAFRILSEQLASVFPDNAGFLDNIGSYHLVKKDFKTALKYYDKVLKKYPEDYTAMQNALLASRRMQNLKLEKKYLSHILKYGAEKDRMLAKGRLDALNSK